MQQKRLSESRFRLAVAGSSPAVPCFFRGLFTVGNGPAGSHQLAAEDPGDQRAILNFTPGPQGRISPLGVNLAPTGEICPLGVKFTPSFTLMGEHSLLFRRMEGRTENFTPKGITSPQGTNSPLGDNFAPGGQSLHPGVKLRMGLRSQSYDRELQRQRC
jgi:hypothetical protein